MDDADTPAGVGVVVVAGGSGSRLGAEVPKAFVEVAGRTLLEHALERVCRVAGLTSLVVVVPEDYASLRHPAFREGWFPVRGVLVAGGAERSDSVRAGLALVDPRCDVVLVHDAARAFTPVAVFDRVVAAVRAGAAGAVPGLPVVDTVKEVDASGVIVATPDRSRLRAVQTPQGFAADVLRAAYAADLTATDDAALVEASGHRVVVVDGDVAAFKVTTPEDLERATALVTRER